MAAIDDIQKQFDMIEVEISRRIKANNVRFYLLWGVFALLVVAGTTVGFLVNEQTHHIWFGLIFLLIPFGGLFLCLAESNNCSNSLMLAKVYLMQDRDLFFQAVGKISCGGMLVVNFLTYLDKVKDGVAIIGGRENS